MKVFAISDTHGQLEGLDPKGADLVVVAGDFGIMKGWGAWHLYAQVDWVNTRLAEWCASYPRTKFRFVPGNHDLFAEQPGLLSEVSRRRTRSSSSTSPTRCGTSRLCSTFERAQ